MKKVLVYHDLGVSPSCYLKLIAALRGALDNQFLIQAVNHRFFLTPDWEEGVALVIFPGGRDLPYHDRLQGIGNARLRSYIEKGGRFFGICAGGYYGASSVEFCKGEPLEVVGKRELSLFAGIAKGPAYTKNPFCYHSDRGYHLAPILWRGGITPIYFNGGCFFEGAESDPNTEILGRYFDLPQVPPAIIFCRVNAGRALLSGVHPEFSPNQLWYELLNKILT